MRLRIDREHDTLYLRLDERTVTESDEVEPGILLDYDEQGRVIGIEILDLSTRAAPGTLGVVQVETL